MRAAPRGTSGWRRPTEQVIPPPAPAPAPARPGEPRSAAPGRPSCVLPHGAPGPPFLTLAVHIPACSGLSRHVSSQGRHRIPAPSRPRAHDSGVLRVPRWFVWGAPATGVGHHGSPTSCAAPSARVCSRPNWDAGIAGAIGVLGPFKTGLGVRGQRCPLEPVMWNWGPGNGASEGAGRSRECLHAGPLSAMGLIPHWRPKLFLPHGLCPPCTLSTSPPQRNCPPSPRYSLPRGSLKFVLWQSPGLCLVLEVLSGQQRAERMGPSDLAAE